MRHSYEMNDASTSGLIWKGPLWELWSSQKEVLLLLTSFQQQDAVEEHPLRSCRPVLVLAESAFALLDGSCCSSPFLV